MYIFGAHSRARTTAHYLEHCSQGLNIDAFLVDNDEVNPREVNQIPVISVKNWDNCMAIHSGLKLEDEVYIGTRSNSHVDIAKRLVLLGFNPANIIPVTPELDMELRNKFLQKYFALQGKVYSKISDTEIGNLNSADICSIGIYVAKTENDVLAEDSFNNRNYETFLQVGAALTSQRITEKNDLGNDSISNKNHQYCELTGLYWIWKNATEEIVGLEHYRRRFLLPADWKERMLSNDIDVILPTPLYVCPNLKENYQERHVKEDFDVLENVMKAQHPDEYEDFIKYFEDGLYSPCNMFVMRREVLTKYCEWLFPILFEAEEHIGIHQDAYQNRYPGFMAERLMSFYFDKHKDEYKLVYCDKNFLK